MNQEFDSYFNTEEEQEGDEIPKSGICSKCLGTKYMIVHRDGSIGALYTTTHQDSNGKPQKRLLLCDCSIDF